MKVIKGLMTKDLLQLKSYKRTLIVFSLIFILTAISQEDVTQAGNMLVIMLTLGFGMFGMATFNYDEMAKADKYVLTFPVTRKEVVLSKYGFIGIATVLGSVLGMILATGFNFVVNGTVNILDILSIGMGSIFGISLVESLQIPCILKSGAEKGRIQMFIIVAIVALVLGGISVLLERFEPFGGSLSFFSVLEPFIPILLLLLSGVFYAISYKVSCHIYEKKEF